MGLLSSTSIMLLKNGSDGYRKKRSGWISKRPCRCFTRSSWGCGRKISHNGIEWSVPHQTSKEGDLSLFNLQGKALLSIFEKVFNRFLVNRRKDVDTRLHGHQDGVRKSRRIGSFTNIARMLEFFLSVCLTKNLRSSNKYLTQVLIYSRTCPSHNFCRTTKR